MVLGILFILAGLLLVVYPPLLSIIVAVVLISVGIGMLSMRYHYRKSGSIFIDNRIIKVLGIWLVNRYFFIIFAITKLLTESNLSTYSWLKS